MKNPSVESFLDNLFTDSARQKEMASKGKTYYYEYRKDYCGTPDKAGECIVLSRRYDRGIDCDILRCQDTGTGEEFSCNQFQIVLKQVGR